MSDHANGTQSSLGKYTKNGMEDSVINQAIRQAKNCLRKCK